ncbi:hypothetical protein [Oceanithermus sp.]
MKLVNVTGALLAAMVILRAAYRVEPTLIQLAYVLLGTSVVLDSITPPLLVRAWFPDEARMRANALVGVVTLGIPVAAWPLAGYLSSLWGSSGLLALAASGFAGKSVLAYVTLPTKAIQPDESLTMDSEESVPVHYAPLLFMVVLALAWLGFLQVAVPAMVDRLPAPGTVYGWYGGLFSLGMAAGAGTLFVIGNRLESARSLTFAGLLLPVGAVLYTLPGVAALLTAGAVYGLGLGAVQTAGATYLQKVVSKLALARVLAWVTSATAAASMIGAFLAGQLLELHVQLATGLAVALTVIIIFWNVSGRARTSHPIHRDWRSRLWRSKERR